MPTLVFGPNATRAHDGDDLAKQSLSESITLAERLMATREFEKLLQLFNEDEMKLNSMLHDTQVCYYNFTIFEEEEKREKETYTEENEFIGNGLSDDVMKKAIEAEKKWKLQTESVNSVFENLDIPLAWIKKRTGDHAKTIYINDTFIKRIKEAHLTPNNHEWRVIVVAQAFSIIHEFAHLSMRWQGIIHTPSKINNVSEVGNYLEDLFFHFRFCILVVRPKWEPWNSSQEIKGEHS